MAFRIHALDPAPFASLFNLPHEALLEHGAMRVTATRKPGFPCRASLVDAEPGEDLLLVNFEHQPATTPFRASHAIYLRKGAQQATPAPDEVPTYLRTRTLSLRAFNGDGMILSAELASGTELEAALQRMLASSPDVATIHLHNAAMGCYLARAERA